MCTNTEQPVILSFFFCIVILGNFENNQISASSKLLQKIIKLSLSLLDLNSILDEQISRSKKKGAPSTYTCNTCGKTMTDKTKMRRHVELHLDLKHFCTICHKNFNTRNALSQHYYNHHGQNVSHTVL